MADPARYLIAYRDMHFGSQRQENIHPRPELDEAELLALLHLVVLFDVPDDTPGQCTGNLPEKNLGAVGGLHGDRRALVQRGRLRMPGHQIFARMVLNETDPTADRIAVDMHVDGRHENRHLNTLVLEVFGFFDFLDHDYFAVSWG